MHLAFGLEHWVSAAPSSKQTAGVIVVLLAALAAYSLLLAAWKLWDALDGDRFARGLQASPWVAFIRIPLLLSVAGLDWLAHDTGALVLEWLTCQRLPTRDRDLLIVTLDHCRMFRLSSGRAGYRGNGCPVHQATNSQQNHRSLARSQFARLESVFECDTGMTGCDRNRARGWYTRANDCGGHDACSRWTADHTSG